MKHTVAITATVLALPVGALASACASEFCAPGSHECPNGMFGALDSGTAASAGMSGNAGASGNGPNGGSGASGGQATGGSDTGGTGTGGTGTGGTDTGGTGPGGTGGDGGSSSCHPTGSPATTPCLVTDAHAVFVAPGGSGDGTMAAPAGTMAAALEQAALRGAVHVIVCNGTFHDSWLLTGGDSGVRIHGGFACPGDAEPWAPASGTPTVAPTALGEALRVDGASDVLIEDVAFTARSAIAAGGSSTGAVVKDASGVVLRRVSVTAGDGLDGTDGVLEPFTDFPSADTLKGNNAVGDAGGTLKQGDDCGVCPAGGTTLGGRGGDGGLAVSAGGQGFPEYGGGAAGTVEACLDSNTGGGNGAPGPSGTDGAPPAAAGQLVGTSWQTSSGAAGLAGGRGQGGGGGGGSEAGGGGGGGGCGACGGAGGPGGTGGGASIGLVVIQSTLTLQNCTITTGTGGDGGKGAAGQNGQENGGFGGVQAGGGCAGGKGGSGGNGAAGSGGSGGSVFGVLHTGDAPAIGNDTTITVGAPGAAGDGGAVGENDGLPGLSAEVQAAG
jgi:hypothetical protein